MKKPTPSQRSLMQRLADFDCWIVWQKRHAGACRIGVVARQGRRRAGE